MLDVNNDVITLTLKVGNEMKMPSRGLFCSFPFLTLTKVYLDGKWVSTEFMPSANSVPNTRHPKTIRQIHFNWKEMNVKIEYDDITKMVKVLEGNVDTVTIRVK